MTEQRLGKGLAALINSNEIQNTNNAYVENFDIEKVKKELSSCVD